MKESGDGDFAAAVRERAVEREETRAARERRLRVIMRFDRVKEKKKAQSSYNPFSYWVRHCRT